MWFCGIYSCTEVVLNEEFRFVPVDKFIFPNFYKGLEYICTFHSGFQKPIFLKKYCAKNIVNVYIIEILWYQKVVIVSASFACHVNDLFIFCHFRIWKIVNTTWFFSVQKIMYTHLWNDVKGKKKTQHTRGSHAKFQTFFKDFQVFPFKPNKTYSFSWNIRKTFYLWFITAKFFIICKPFGTLREKNKRYFVSLYFPDFWMMSQMSGGILCKTCRITGNILL